MAVLIGRVIGIIFEAEAGIKGLQESKIICNSSKLHFSNCV